MVGSPDLIMLPESLTTKFCVAVVEEESLLKADSFLNRLQHAETCRFYQLSKAESFEFFEPVSVRSIAERRQPSGESTLSAVRTSSVL